MAGYDKFLLEKQRYADLMDAFFRSAPSGEEIALDGYDFKWAPVNIGHVSDSIHGDITIFDLRLIRPPDTDIVSGELTIILKKPDEP